MNKLLKWPLGLACALVLSMGATSCSDDDNDTIDTTPSEKEQALQRAVTPFVNNTVIPTYKNMADAALELYKKCQTIEENFDNGTLTTEDVASAGESWNTARKYWELSEALPTSATK